MNYNIKVISAALDSWISDVSASLKSVVGSAMSFCNHNESVILSQAKYSIVPAGAFVAIAVSYLLWASVFLGNDDVDKGHQEGKEEVLHKDLSPPPRAPVGVLGIMRNFSKGNAPWFLEQMVEETGSDIYQLKPKLYVVGNVNAAREILTDKLSTKPSLYACFVTVFGAHNTFSRPAADSVWHSTRKALNRSFSPVETNRMNRVALKHVQKWIDEMLEPAIATGLPIDLSHEMSRIAFKVIVEACLEYTATDSEFEDFSRHVQVGMHQVFFKNVHNPLRKYYAPFLPQYREALKSCAELQGFGRKILEAYRANPNKSSDHTAIKAFESDGVCVDEDHKVAEISALVMAGQDSTGFTLGSTLMLLSKHQEIQDKLRAELLSMKTAERSKCAYMRNVVKETSRLLPVAPLGTARRIGRDITCKNNIGSMIIPKDSIMYVPTMLLHRNPSVFDRPKEFLPERWENATEEMRASVMPFSFGQRNCPGKPLGLAEWYSAIPKLVADYKFEVEDQGTLTFSGTMSYSGASVKVSKVLAKAM